MFHTCTGCDIVSSTYGWGKKTACNTWMNLDNITTAFCALVATVDVSAIDDWMEALEQFVTLFYDHTSSQTLAQKQLSTKNGQAINGLFPQHKQQ